MLVHREAATLRTRRDRGVPILTETAEWPRAGTGTVFDKLSAFPGVPLGTLCLLSGNEGSGKSTACLKLLEAFAEAGVEGVYATFEMPVSMVDMLALRAGIRPNRNLIVTTQVPIVEGPHGNPAAIVLDSIQSFPCDDEETDGARAEAALRWAMRYRKLCPYIFIVLISQHNAEGEVFGTRKVRHWVDIVAELELREEKDGSFLRYFHVRKSRFGPPGEFEV